MIFILYYYRKGGQRYRIQNAFGGMEGVTFMSAGHHRLKILLFASRHKLIELNLSIDLLSHSCNNKRND